MTKVFSGRNINDRMKLLCNRIDNGLLDEDMHRLASKIVNSCKSKDEMCELKKIFNWGKKNLRYQGEIQEIDIYRSPQMSVEIGAADCDDHFIVMSMLGMILGYQVRARAVSEDGDTETHIYPLFGLPRIDPEKWVALDIAEGDSLGWEPKNIEWYQDFELRVIQN